MAIPRKPNSDDLLDTFEDELSVEELEDKEEIKRLSLLAETQGEYLKFLKLVFERASAKNDIKSLLEDKIKDYLKTEDPEKQKEVSLRSIMQLYEIVSKNENDFISNTLSSIVKNDKEKTGLGAPQGQLPGRREKNITPISGDKQKSAKKVLDILKDLEDLGKTEFTDEEIQDLLKKKKE